MNDSPEKTPSKPFEFKYATLGDVKKMQVQGLTNIGQSFKDACDSIGQSFALSLAKIRMDEAVVCAVEHITNKGVRS